MNYKNRVKSYRNTRRKSNRGGKRSVNTRSKRANTTLQFLKTVCADSGVCIAFGKETDKIKSFFDNFVYKYKKSRKELSKGENGVIYEIEYERMKYKAYTIIKIAKVKDSDNLIYEYIVGINFINTWYKKLPCFLETYNWCTNPEGNPTFQLEKTIHELISVSCKNPLSIGIQLEYIKSPKPIRLLLSSSSFWRDNIFQTLFQVYFPLVCLGNNFTHYDLHDENVLLWIPVENHYIHYHYHAKTTVSFKSPYATKIIDYGRCYFKSSTVDSLQIHHEVCSNPSCNKPQCGQELGFSWLMNPQSKNGYFINSSISNISHDLRLLNIVSEYYQEKSNYNFFFQENKTYDNFFLQQDIPIAKIFLKNIIYENNYGTPQIIDQGFPKYTANIYDALSFLTEICSSQKFIEHNDKLYDSKLKLGDLHVYNDGRNMEFIPI